MALHTKCRHPNVYPGEKISRFPVPDEKVRWNVDFPAYHPVEHTAKSVLNKPVWADPDIRFGSHYLYFVSIHMCMTH